MATRHDKIEELLIEHKYVNISPYCAAESNFTAEYLGRKKNIFMFIDENGNYWDCEDHELNEIQLTSRESLYFDHIKDDTVETDILREKEANFEMLLLDNQTEDFCPGVTRTKL